MYNIVIFADNVSGIQVKTIQPLKNPHNITKNQQFPFVLIDISRLIKPDFFYQDPCIIPQEINENVVKRQISQF